MVCEHASFHSQRDLGSTYGTRFSPESLNAPQLLHLKWQYTSALTASAPSAPPVAMPPKLLLHLRIEKGLKHSSSNNHPECSRHWRNSARWSRGEKVEPPNRAAPGQEYESLSIHFDSRQRLGFDISYMRRLSYRSMDSVKAFFRMSVTYSIIYIFHTRWQDVQ